MIEKVRASTLSAALMQAASKGALALPAQETIEILVYLATQNKVFGEQARLTLAGWDEKASVATAADPHAPAEVLAYFADSRNLRPVLLPALFENPSVPDQKLAAIALSANVDTLQLLTASQRARSSNLIVQSLKQNPRLSSAQRAALDGVTAEVKTEAGENPPEAATKQHMVIAHSSAETDSPELNLAVGEFLKVHAAELNAEAGKPFQPIGGIIDDSPDDTSEEAKAEPAVAPAPSGPKKAAVDVGSKKESTLQKIAKLDISGRIQLAMKGTKEERGFLVRDGTKLVALAVLESPKISDGEVEKIAGQKNVLEAVLRAIPMKRKFAKNYSIMRNLVFNPRTPIDLSLTLMKNLMVGDLKALSGNKEVSETIRKLALRMHKQKMENKD